MSRPFEGIRLYVEPASRAAMAAPDLSGDARTATDYLAGKPVATWFGEDSPPAIIKERLQKLTNAATSAHRVPVVVSYAIPGRDCGGPSDGGAGSPAEYRTWIDSFAAGIGQAKIVVIVEPDALSQLECLSVSEQQTRIELVQYAVDRITANPNALVYLDSGNSRWQSASVMAERLLQADVAKATGFALNVSNFNWVSTESAYGANISTLIGGKHFVVDTSRNGAGPPDGNLWCNPPGRALGVDPLTPTDDPLIDALLWIKTPGVSDGACGPGQPSAGSYWPEYAQGLVARRPR